MGPKPSTTAVEKYLAFSEAQSTIINKSLGLDKGDDGFKTKTDIAKLINEIKNKNGVNPRITTGDVTAIQKHLESNPRTQPTSSTSSPPLEEDDEVRSNFSARSGFSTRTTTTTNSNFASPQKKIKLSVSTGKLSQEIVSDLYTKDLAKIDNQFKPVFKFSPACQNLQLSIPEIIS